MAALERIAANLRAILAAHVPLELVDRRCFRPPHDRQCHSLMVSQPRQRTSIAVSGIEGGAETRRWLSRSFETQHTLVPGDTRYTVSFLPSLGRALRRMPDRTAIDALARLGAHQGKSAPAWRRPASCYRSGWFSEGTQGVDGLNS
jgi:hypothetical protein